MAMPIARLGVAGGAPGGRAVVAMVASSARQIFRSGLPLSSSRSRWSPSRTYQPPSGSLADRPAPGWAAAEQRDWGGVQAGTAVKGGGFGLGQDRDAGLQQGVDQRLEAAAGGGGLFRGHGFGVSSWTGQQT